MKIAEPNDLEATVSDYEISGNAWITVKLKADQLEEGRAAYLDSLINALARIHKDESEAKLKRMAQGSTEYGEYVDRMCIARAEMLRFKVRFDAVGMLFEAKRSQLSFEKEKIAKGIFHVGK